MGRQCACGTECVRFAEGGEVLERVTTSMPCFACMLGDDDRRTLYLVIARRQRREQGSAGSPRRHREGPHDHSGRRAAVTRRVAAVKAAVAALGTSVLLALFAALGAVLACRTSRRGGACRDALRSGGGRIGLRRVPAHVDPSPRLAHRIGLHRRPGRPGSDALARPHPRAHRLSGRDDRNHDRRGRALCRYPRRHPAPDRPRLLAHPLLHRVGHGRPGLQRRRPLPAPHGPQQCVRRQRLGRGAGHSCLAS